MIGKQLRRRSLLGSLAALGLGTAASAQELQNQPIRFVVPFAAGGAVDFVGRLVGNKGAETIAEAGFLLRRKYPDIRLVFVGEGSSVPERIRERTAEEGAEANVELQGFVPLAELPARYRAAHVFCSPATYEGFGQTAIEAMACGCPAVVSDAGGGAEAVIDGETGFVVPPGDVAATARALDLILGDAAIRGRLSAAAIERVADHFAMDRYIGRVLAVYEKAITRSRRLSDDDKEQLDWRRPQGPFIPPPTAEARS